MASGLDLVSLTRFIFMQEHLTQPNNLGAIEQLQCLFDREKMTNFIEMIVWFLFCEGVHSLVILNIVTLLLMP